MSGGARLQSLGTFLQMLDLPHLVSPEKAFSSSKAKAVFPSQEALRSHWVSDQTECSTSSTCLGSVGRPRRRKCLSAFWVSGERLEGNSFQETPSKNPPNSARAFTMAKDPKLSADGETRKTSQVFELCTRKPLTGIVFFGDILVVEKCLVF